MTLRLVTLKKLVHKEQINRVFLVSVPMKSARDFSRANPASASRNDIMSVELPVRKFGRPVGVGL